MADNRVLDPEFNEVVGKRVPVWSDNNIKQTDKVAAYAKHPDYFVEDFGIQNGSFSNTLQKMSPKQRENVIGNLYHTIAGEDDVRDELVEKINGKKSWSNSSLKKFAHNVREEYDEEVRIARERLSRISGLRESEIPANNSLSHNYSLSEAYDNILEKTELSYSDAKKDLGKQRFLEKFKDATPEQIGSFVEATNNLTTRSKGQMASLLGDSGMFLKDAETWNTNKNYQTLNGFTEKMDISSKAIDKISGYTPTEESVKNNQNLSDEGSIDNSTNNSKSGMDENSHAQAEASSKTKTAIEDTEAITERTQNEKLSDAISNGGSIETDELHDKNLIEKQANEDLASKVASDGSDAYDSNTDKSTTKAAPLSEDQGVSRSMQAKRNKEYSFGEIAEGESIMPKERKIPNLGDIGLEKADLGKYEGKLQTPFLEDLILEKKLPQKLATLNSLLVWVLL